MSEGRDVELDNFRMAPSRKRRHLHHDKGDIKVIPFKKPNVDCCEEDQLKTIKINRESSSDEMRYPFLCDICSASLKSRMI